MIGLWQRLQAAAIRAQQVDPTIETHGPHGRTQGRRACALAGIRTHPLMQTKPGRKGEVRLRLRASLQFNSFSGRKPESLRTATIAGSGSTTAQPVRPETRASAANVTGMIGQRQPGTSRLAPHNIFFAISALPDPSAIATTTH